MSKDKTQISKLYSLSAAGIERIMRQISSEEPLKGDSLLKRNQKEVLREIYRKISEKSPKQNPETIAEEYQPEIKKPQEENVETPSGDIFTDLDIAPPAEAQIVETKNSGGIRTDQFQELLYGFESDVRTTVNNEQREEITISEFGSSYEKMKPLILAEVYLRQAESIEKSQISKKEPPRIAGKIDPKIAVKKYRKEALGLLSLAFKAAEENQKEVLYQLAQFSEKSATESKDITERRNLLNKAIRFYEKTLGKTLKDYQKSPEELEKAALAGDKFAMFRIAEHYKKNKEDEKAAVLYEKLRDEGNMSILSLLAGCYQKLGAHQKASELYGILLRAGDNSAALEIAGYLARMNTKNAQDNQRFHKMALLTEEEVARRENDVDKLFDIAERYRNGKGINNDSNKAIALFQEISEMEGVAPNLRNKAILHLGLCHQYMHVEGSEKSKEHIEQKNKNIEEAIKFYEQIISKDKKEVLRESVGKALIQIANIYKNGDLQKKAIIGFKPIIQGKEREEKYLEYIKKAAALKHPQAQYALAQHYFYRFTNKGRLTSDNSIPEYMRHNKNKLNLTKEQKEELGKEIFSLCKFAQENGCKEAIALLATLYSAGVGTKADYKKAENLLCESAEIEGNTQSKYDVWNFIDSDDYDEEGDKKDKRQNEEPSKIKKFRYGAWYLLESSEGPPIANTAIFLLGFLIVPEQAVAMEDDFQEIMVDFATGITKAKRNSLWEKAERFLFKDEKKQKEEKEESLRELNNIRIHLLKAYEFLFWEYQKLRIKDRDDFVSELFDIEETTEAFKAIEPYISYKLSRVNTDLTFKKFELYASAIMADHDYYPRCSNEELIKHISKELFENFETGIDEVMSKSPLKRLGVIKESEDDRNRRESILKKIEIEIRNIHQALIKFKNKSEINLSDARMAERIPLLHKKFEIIEAELERKMQKIGKSLFVEERKQTLKEQIPGRPQQGSRNPTITDLEESLLGDAIKLLPIKQPRRTYKPPLPGKEESDSDVELDSIASDSKEDEFGFGLDHNQAFNPFREVLETANIEYFTTPAAYNEPKEQKAGIKNLTDYIGQSVNPHAPDLARGTTTTTIGRKRSGSVLGLTEKINKSDDDLLRGFSGTKHFDPLDDEQQSERSETPEGSVKSDSGIRLGSSRSSSTSSTKSDISL